MTKVRSEEKVSKIQLEDLGKVKYILLLCFVIFSLLYVHLFQLDVMWEHSIVLVIATLFWIYMAINIGANDVANNMWPAVWAKAISLAGAIIIAAIFEASGALIAGGDVVNTIKKWIIDPSLITDSHTYVVIMMSTLMWAAVWINIATYLKAPVSATHSIIGWLIGAWIAGVGIEIVNWNQIWLIMASWVISPLMWWGIAACIFIAITYSIFSRDNRSEAAKTWVPIYIGLMTWAFSSYLLMKWLTNLFDQYAIEIHLWDALIVWFFFALIVTIITMIHLKGKNYILKNSKKSINHLFNIPLIFAVALLSFAHGANDVANAIGPLAAIVESIQWWGWTIGQEVWIPFWVMIVWALGLSIWLIVFGWRLIKTVGKWITKLNQSRAFSVALAAAITVIIATQYWLPVSSTHIAIGGIFGIWFARQFLKHIHWVEKHYIESSMIKHIALAWVITLPVSWLIAAGMFYSIMFVTQ